MVKTSAGGGGDSGHLALFVAVKVHVSVSPGTLAQEMKNAVTLILKWFLSGVKIFRKLKPHPDWREFLDQNC